MKPWLVPVGGFLGAGKTTLILTAARILAKRGLKCGAILNDQAGDLVDSAFVEARGVKASAVTGGCFCCRFSELMDAAAELRARSLDVIFAEPVGSCTDLSATILQPIKREFGAHYRLAPLTVVVDPARAADLGEPNTRFLFENQIAEADLILFNKCDRHTNFPELAAAEVRYVSAQNGEGVEAWLDEILNGSLPVGSKVLDIDYLHYARAEAALGWLNWSATVWLGRALSPAALMGPWVDSLQQSLFSAGASIAHLKVLDQTPHTYLKIALTNSISEPEIEGDLTASPELEHTLRLNLRAVMDATQLRALFSETLASLPGVRHDERLQCFRPFPPRPEHRLADIVS